MFASIIKVKEVSQRIDPEHHNPELLDMKNRVKAAFPTSTFRKESSRMNSGPFGSALLSSAYVDKERGVLFVRPQDCKGLVVNEDNDNVYISHDDHTRLKSSKFQAGDLIITKIGNGIGDMAVVPAHVAEVNISGNAMGAVISEHDSYFAVSYLRGKYGQAEIKRGLSGGAKPKIDMESIGSIVFPLVNPIVQKYIGDKVRQAEMLSEHKKLLSSAPAIVEALLCGKLQASDVLDAQRAIETGDISLDITLMNRFFNKSLDSSWDFDFVSLMQKVRSSSVDGEREDKHVNTIDIKRIDDFLTAQTYRPEITTAYSLVEQFNCNLLQSLCVEPIRQGATPTFVENGRNCLKSKQTREIFLDDVGYEQVDPNDPENRSIVRLQDGDIVLTRQGAGTIGRASIFSGNEEVYITDSLFLIRLDSEQIDPGFLAAFLRSYTGQRLIEKGVYGSTGQLNLGNSHVRRVPVPTFDKTIQVYIGNKIRLLDKLNKIEKSLIKSAKNIVENLIDGHITDQYLVDAQKALESGDNSLDRALLSQLTNTGFNDGGKPLFDDLDQFYDLLNQSKECMEAGA